MRGSSVGQNICVVRMRARRGFGFGVVDDQFDAGGAGQVAHDSA